jgi:hypothetical protein
MVFITILIILTCGSILLLNYIRPGLPAVLEAVIAVLGSWCSASWPSNVWSLTMRYVTPSHLPHTDVEHWYPSATPPRLSLFSTLSSPAPAHFWLVVVWLCLIGGRQKPRCIYYYIFFCHSIRHPKGLDSVPYRAPCPPPASAITYPLPLPLTLGWLLGVLINWQPPKAKAPSSFQYMRLALAPQTGEPTAALPDLMAHALHRPMGSGGTMSCWRHCPTHGERGQSRWRVGQQWSILVVLLCVLWVVGSREEFCYVSSTSVKWQIWKSHQQDAFKM